MRSPVTILLVTSSALALARVATPGFHQIQGCKNGDCSDSSSINKVATPGVVARQAVTTEKLTLELPVTDASTTKADTTKVTAVQARAGCSTGQVVMNPSFYGLPPDYAPNISPWSITHEFGSPGCTYDPNSYAEADHDQYYGDERSIKCAFPHNGGQDIIGQTITNMCPGQMYTLTVHVACDYGTEDNYTLVYTDYRVDFDGVCRIEPQYACTPCDPDTEDCDRPIYQAVSAHLPGPASGTAELQIFVGQKPTLYSVLPLLLDLVYLQGADYNGTLLDPTL